MLITAVCVFSAIGIAVWLYLLYETYLSFVDFIVPLVANKCLHLYRASKRLLIKV
mgnify:CR=1 FL=1